MLDFIASNGSITTDPDAGANLFEVPIGDPRSIETVNFDVPPATGEPPPEEPRRRR